MEKIQTKQKNEDAILCLSNMPQNFFYYPPLVFTGKIYGMWNVKVNTRLHAKESWDIVSKGCVEPTYEEYQKKNNVVLSLIRQDLDVKILPKIEEVISIKEAWSILEKQYNEKGSFVHVAEHEHEEGESHCVDTLMDDEVDEIDAEHEHDEGESHCVDTPLDDEVDEIIVEAKHQLMQCLHLDID